ncbi:type VI secretion system tip protein TssI/VgrG [Curvibacter sp. HBC28]|uniref:Type VI secretion system tip protein TssI/VgrG n=1 Tax=Curvibacter microcysteis TaxID=3026419 RepID=A0ABT5MHT0_9BURK|nr:type VI secretion system tip protein TssI/VgrG [Curvibacter sp. HBC28]MDD0815429.1 type VI secretion system tip protein TssI/VgrG [Curvibacter sp. HBC28]
MPRNLSYWSAVSLNLKGSPAFEVKSVHGHEALGELFLYTVTLQTPDSPDLTAFVSANLPYKQMVGKEAGLTLEVDGGGTRQINALVTSARFLHAENRRSLYQVTLQPWLVLATRTSDHKIFQHKTVVDITQEVLADYPYLLELRLSQSYPPRTFQVQYGETDFAFLSRLWQEWGIYYFWEHEGGKHKLILVDDAGAHLPCPGVYAHINYYGPSAKIDEEYCSQFQTHEGLQSGVWVTDDFDFEKPRARLQQKIKMPRQTGHEDLERYHWPGDYVVADEGRDLARTRLEEAGAPGQRASGMGNLRGVACGHTFTLDKHPHQAANQSYLVIASTLSLRENSHAAGEEGWSCHCQFELQPARNTFRSPQTQPKPLTTGPQTAIVTGPPGEEIFTDPYSRVKLSFHWNRYCSKDQNSSCWVRVSSPWAGNQFGGIAIPRVGQEVIVDFENGDPDKPIVTGRVYNALNMPPWELPANMTQSGVKTKSTVGGTPGPGLKDGVGECNVLRFEDKKGQEQLWVHAQKDQLTEVEHDEDKWVGNDRRKTVDGNETSTIHKNRTETVDIDETITVHGKRTETVDLDQSETVHQNDTQTIDLDQTLTVHKSRTRTVGLNESVSIGVNRSKQVGVNESDTIGANWSVTTGKMKTENVGLGYTQTTGVCKMVNIGVAYNLNVGAVMMSNVGMLRMDTVGMNWTRNTGVDETTQVGANQSVTVGADHSLKVAANSKTDVGTNAETKAGAKIKGEAPEIELVAAGTLKLTCGGSTIVMTPGSIELKSPLIQINP